MSSRIAPLIAQCLISMLILFALAAAPISAQGSPLALKLHQALFVEGPDNSQPSGLTLCNGTLLAVSDKHDDTVFKIRIGPDVAYMEPYLTFSAPSQGWFQRLDFEGITCDSLGNLFLISETRSQILHLTPDGARASWITPNLEPLGREKGLFKVDNAHLEGISLVAPNRFVLCAERQPRGFVEVDLSTEPAQVSAYTADSSNFTFAGHRSPDFSGLYVHKNSLYVLERNAFVVVKLVRRADRWVESTGWSYEHIVDQPAYRYADTRYGKAEGLSMDDRYVYLILDNNGIARARNPRDKRPLLLILHRP